MNQRLSFPGGDFVKARPSKAELENSALAWLTLAQTQLGDLSFWIEQKDRTQEAIRSLDALRSQLGHIRRAIAESESSK